jgi:hypothetical protein
MVVTVKEFCEPCQQLREEVKEREAKNYWPQWFVKIKSCAGCFEAAKSRAAAEASGEVYGYC